MKDRLLRPALVAVSKKENKSKKMMKLIKNNEKIIKNKEKPACSQKLALI